MAKEGRVEVKVYLASASEPVIRIADWFYVNEDRLNDNKEFISVGNNFFRKSDILRIVTREFEVEVPDKEENGKNQ